MGDGVHADAARASDARLSSRTSRPHVLFYDASCGLCRRSVALIQRIGPTEPVAYIDVNDNDAMARYPEVDRLEALKRIIMLRRDGKQLGAYDAVTGVMRLLPRWRRLYFLARLWPVQLVGHAVYHLVGRHRHKISRMLGWD